nr:hypothetical protein [Mycoplasmopsis bovis]
MSAVPWTFLLELAPVPWSFVPELASVPWSFVPELALYLNFFVVSFTWSFV